MWCTKQRQWIIELNDVKYIWNQNEGDCLTCIIYFSSVLRLWHFCVWHWPLLCLSYCYSLFWVLNGGIWRIGGRQCDQIIHLCLFFVSLFFKGRLSEKLQLQSDAFLSHVCKILYLNFIFFSTFFLSFVLRLNAVLVLDLYKIHFEKKTKI